MSFFNPRNDLFKPKKDREYLPKVNIVEFEEDDPDKFEKIIHFAERYRIPYTIAGHKKSYKELLDDIKNYELKHIKSIAKIGKEKKYDIYGLHLAGGKSYKYY